jgi:hypothetical protein
MGARGREKITYKTPRFDALFFDRPIYHQRSVEAEYNSNDIAKGKSLARGLHSEALLNNFDRVGIACG